MDDFLSYYAAELAYLREEGAEFAERFPKIAGRLLLGPDGTEDPHVERLLEGFAFLAARVRQKLDDEFPEITSALLQSIDPNALRPWPSATIVRLRPGPDPGAVEKGITVPAGTKLTSPEVDGLPCTFRTCYPVTLWPVDVTDARVEPDAAGAPGAPAEAVAQLRITVTGPEDWSVGPLFANPDFKLRLYLDGDAASVHAIYESLFNHLRRVAARDPFGDDEAGFDGPDVVQVGFGPDEFLVPDPPTAPSGPRLLREYFTLPEKFFFIDLSGWARLAGKGLGRSVELVFHLDRRLPPSAKVSARTFLTGCAPAVNLLSVVCDPIRLDQSRPEYRVRPDAERPWAYEVHSVDAVTGVGGFLGGAVDYLPFLGASAGAGGAPSGDEPYWHATRRRSIAADDEGSEVDLAFVDAAFHPDAPASETVTVEATCTNRDLPTRLAFGGNAGAWTLHTTVGVDRTAWLLRKPTPTRRPPVGRDVQWRLVSRLTLNHLSLAESGRGVEALRQVLGLHDPADDVVSRQQIAGVVRVSGKPTTGRLGESICQGTEVTVTFDERRYVGASAFLFACVLERFFGGYAAINAFTRFVATTEQNGELKRWPPRAGDRRLV